MPLKNDIFFLKKLQFLVKVECKYCTRKSIQDLKTKKCQIILHRVL
jgi:hypothetical protein